MLRAVGRHLLGEDVFSNRVGYLAPVAFKRPSVSRLRMMVIDAAAVFRLSGSKVGKVFPRSMSNGRGRDLSIIAPGRRLYEYFNRLNNDCASYRELTVPTTNDLSLQK
jgi:hypothetical protein